MKELNADAIAGVKVVEAGFGPGREVVGVESGNAELGVSGYVIEKGPGV